MTPSGTSKQTSRGKSRGPYANGQQRREEFVDQALDVFASQGFQRLSLRKIAEALGVSHAALSYYFPSKEDLLKAVFDTQAERERPFVDQGLTERGLLDFLPQLGQTIQDIPQVIQLDVTIQAEAVNPNHTAHNYARQRMDELNQTTRRELEKERDRGRLRADLDLDVTTRQLTALVRGLQLQWLYDPDIRLDTHLEAFVALLRPPPQTTPPVAEDPRPSA